MASTDVGVRCHFHLLDIYLSKLPPKASFYMQPLGVHVTKQPSKPWFSSQPCGENKLSAMVKSMFERIGICGKTNHSLRATGATEMFRAEKIIQEHTGHRIHTHVTLSTEWHEY